jgi:hypothetical protein
VTATLDAAASCSLQDTQIGPDIHLGNYLIDVPDTPIVLVASPVLKFSISGDANASGSATASASESASADAGIKVVNSKVTPVATFSHQFGYEAPSYTANATLNGAVRAQLTVGIDGTGLGPDIAINNALNFTADSTANPCWTLSDELSATAGVDLDDFADVPDQTVYDQTFLLAQSHHSCQPIWSGTITYDETHQETFTGPAVGQSDTRSTKIHWTTSVVADSSVGSPFTYSGTSETGSYHDDSIQPPCEYNTDQESIPGAAPVNVFQDGGLAIDPSAGTYSIHFPAFDVASTSTTVTTGPDGCGDGTTTFTYPYGGYNSYNGEGEAIGPVEPIGADPTHLQGSWSPDINPPATVTYSWDLHLVTPTK